MALDQALAALDSGVCVIALLGEAGTGKSLMLSVLADRLRACRAEAMLVTRPDCGLDLDTQTMLLIDEAGWLDDAALARLGRRGVVCVLAGLPSLGERLAACLDHGRMQPLRTVVLQRVAEDEVGAFAEALLIRRGCGVADISDAAVRFLADASGGIARLIDALSGSAGYVAALELAPRIEARHVAEAVALGVGGGAASSASPPLLLGDAHDGLGRSARPGALAPGGPEFMSYAGDFVDAPVSLGTVARIANARRLTAEVLGGAAADGNATRRRWPVVASLAAVAVAAVLCGAILRAGLSGPDGWQRLADAGQGAATVAAEPPPLPAAPEHLAPMQMVAARSKPVLPPPVLPPPVLPASVLPASVLPASVLPAPVLPAPVLPTPERLAAALLHSDVVAQVSPKPASPLIMPPLSPPLAPSAVPSAVPWVPLLGAAVAQAAPLVAPGVAPGVVPVAAPVAAPVVGPEPSNVSAPMPPPFALPDAQTPVLAATVEPGAIVQARAMPASAGVAAARIVVRYAKGDPAAAHRAGELAALLRSRSLATADPLAEDRLEPAAVTYFFAEDAPTAETVARSVAEFLAGAGERARVAPRWTQGRASAHTPMPPMPGTINVFVEGSRG